MNNENKNFEQRYIYITLALCSILYGFTLYSNPFATLLPTHDQSMFLYIGRGMIEGMVPYTEMFDHKGPLLWFINAIGWIGIGKFKLLWLIEIIFAFLSSLWIYKVVRYFVSSQIALFTTIVSLLMLTRFSVGGNISEEFALPFIAWGLLFLVRYFKGQTNSTAFIGFGLAGTMVFLLRANMISLWVVGVFAIIIWLIINKKPKDILKNALLTILGALLVIIPVSTYHLFTDSFSEMIYGSLTFNFIYSDNEGHLNLFSMIVFVLGTLFLYGVLFPSIYLLVQNFTRKKERYLYLFLSIYGLLNLVTILISKRTYSHYIITQIPISALALGLFIAWLLHFKKLDNWKSKFSNFPIVFLLLMWIIGGLGGPLVGGIEFAKKFYSLGDSDELYHQEQIIADYIRENSSRGDSIYVWRFDANIYNLSERFANSQYFILPSITLGNYPEIDNTLVDSFETNPPAFFIAKPNFFKGEVSTTEQRIIDIIETKYEQTQIKDTNDSILVFKLERY